VFLLCSGCATTNKDTEASARWKNAGIGAAIGCVVTGPFSLLPVGPMIGAIIGGVVSVDGEEKATAEVKTEVKSQIEEAKPESSQTARTESPFGERQKNF
jgi:hypothetical protein